MVARCLVASAERRAGGHYFLARHMLLLLQVVVGGQSVLHIGSSDGGAALQRIFCSPIFYSLGTSNQLYNCCRAAVAAAATAADVDDLFLFRAATGCYHTSSYTSFLIAECSNTFFHSYGFDLM